MKERSNLTIQTPGENARLTLAWTFLLCLILPVTTATATSLGVSVTCEDSELGGGPIFRQYTCDAIASGGTAPYDFDWFAWGAGAPTVVPVGANHSRAFYYVYDCYGPTFATGGVTVTDDASDQAVDADTVLLDCP